MRLPRAPGLARAALMTALAGIACTKERGSTTATGISTGTTGEPTSSDVTGGSTQSTTSITTIETIGDVSTSSGTAGGTTNSTGPGMTTGLETGMFTDTGTGDDSTAGTGSSTGGGLGEGADCQDQPDACAPGLLCCYPCGIPDCTNKCSKPDPRTMMCPLLP